MADELKTIKFQLMLSESEAKAMDDWGFGHRIRTRAEAIRRLCQIGLAVEAKTEGIFQQNLNANFAAVAVMDAMGRIERKEDGFPEKIVPARNALEESIDELLNQNRQLYDAVKELLDVAWIAKSPIKTDEVQELIAENEKLYDRILGRERGKPVSE
ncbi:hypothetical protein [Rhizobium rhizogenes]|uniref:hypothetical protein n=1 Tax=Rhizobium rhizogenes TaxID=359 RepID=UPI001573604B|nr:hypothetical protein [Rhizobium rhizogenes]NTI27130.1 hypothetical protein [Rhizobium rhizogenes]